MKKITNIIFAGLGGQGVLKATDILAEALFKSGFDVKKSEVHGMSQRGGSVSSEVRYGEKVYSPMVPFGEADYLIVLEPTQTEVNLMRLKHGGVLIDVADLPADQLENAKSLNTMMLGALSKVLPDIKPEKLLATVKKYLPEKLHEANARAFELGRKSIR